jgi:menaquinone-9 beta-reductase
VISMGKNPDELWDAIIVGAGPAGGVSAAILASRGWRVLLVDRAIFPREKTCGGCVNARAAQMLRDLGLESVLHSAEPLVRFDLNIQSRQLHCPIPTGFAISRSELDSAIVGEAQRRGCVFISGISASLIPANPDAPLRQVTLRSGASTVTVGAPLVLACDGIAGTLLDSEPGVAWQTAKNPWLGISTILEPSGSAIKSGTVQMNLGRGGYVGLAKLSDGRLHLAAALDPRACQSAGSAGQLIQKILSEARQLSPADLNSAKFFGIGRYTRQRTRLGSHRVLAVGDAVGYVEPFTGEGIAWAIEGAREATNLLPDPAADWPQTLPQLWANRHYCAIGRHQWRCRTLRYLARRPTLAASALAFVSAFPVIPDTIAQWVCRPDSYLHVPAREALS